MIYTIIVVGDIKDSVKSYFQNSNQKQPNEKTLPVYAIIRTSSADAANISFGQHDYVPWRELAFEYLLAALRQYVAGCNALRSANRHDSTARRF